MKEKKRKTLDKYYHYEPRDTAKPVADERGRRGGHINRRTVENPAYPDIGDAFAGGRILTGSEMDDIFAEHGFGDKYRSSVFNPKVRSGRAAVALGLEVAMKVLKGVAVYFRSDLPEDDPGFTDVLGRIDEQKEARRK